MATIEYTETDEQGLDLIGPLWQKLLEYHKSHSPRYFFGRYAEMTLSQRNKELLDRAVKGRIRIDLARDMDTGDLVGYCVSTIAGDRQGEIESIYIEPGYRRSGIGDNMMKRVLRWMDDMSVTKKILKVGAGNEDVFEFYRRYNFYPRITIMEQVDSQL